MQTALLGRRADLSSVSLQEPEKHNAANPHDRFFKWTLFTILQPENNSVPAKMQSQKIRVHRMEKMEHPHDELMIIDYNFQGERQARNTVNS